MKIFLASVLFANSWSCASDHEPRQPSGTGFEDVPVHSEGGAPPEVRVEGTMDGYAVTVKQALAGAVNAYTFVGTRVESRHIEVAITSYVDVCGSATSEGTTLFLELFQNGTLPESEVTEPGRFSVWLPTIRGAEIPNDNRVVAHYVLRTGGGGTSSLATSGHVTVTSVTQAEIAGELALDFADGNVSGSFAAPRCKEWNRGAGIPAPRQQQLPE